MGHHHSKREVIQDNFGGMLTFEQAGGILKCFYCYYEYNLSPSLCRLTTYFATLLPDSMAPSMKPTDSRAISVPAQWIRPSGFLRSSMLESTPGGKLATGPPMAVFSSQGCQTTSVGCSILDYLKNSASFRTSAFQKSSLPFQNLQTPPPIKTARAGWNFPSEFDLVSSKTFIAGPSKQSESTSPENPFFFQQASGYRTSTLAILPIKDLSQIILLCTDRAGEKATSFTLGGGIAMMRYEPSMTSPFELVTTTLFQLCSTDLTKKLSLIQPPLLLTSSLRKMLMCWVPLEVFFSWRPFLIVIKFQKSREQRTQYKRQRKLTSESQTPKMTLRAPSIMTLVFIEVRFSSIQDWTVIESHLAAIKQSPGFYGTFFAILLSFIRVNCISINAKIFPILGISPVYAQLPSLRCITFLPLSSTGMRSFLDYRASSMACVWVGPMNCAPRSKLTSLITDVLVLPPTQSLAQRTVTWHLALLRSSRAAVSPERPAPTTITSRPVFSSYFISQNDKLPDYRD